MKWLNKVGTWLMGGALGYDHSFWKHWQYWVLWLAAWSWAGASYYQGKWEAIHERNER